MSGEEPGADALALRVARYETAMLERALWAMSGTVASSRLRTTAEAYAAQGIAAGAAATAVALVRAEHERDDIVGSRTFRTFAALSGFERRRAARPGTLVEDDQAGSPP